MRGVRYTVLKNPGKLTDRRSEASGNLRDTVYFVKSVFRV